MNWDFNQFHFIRPMWLLALPLLWGLWLLMRQKQAESAWEQHISQRLLSVLRMTTNSQTNWWRRMLLLAWTLSIFAAAGPTWQKLPVPIQKNQHSMAVLLDLSPSMLATDLKPDRLTLAKYKLIDILRERKDGQTALVAYAGDAHVVSPLSDDANSIEILLPALHPTIMPQAGSNVENAIRMALQLLRDAQSSNGEILLISDGIASEALSTIRMAMPSSVKLSILSVGGAQAAPIPAANGGFVKNRSGEIVLTAPNIAELQRLARATGGRFSELRTDNQDIDTLFGGQQNSPMLLEASAENKHATTTYDHWVDMGHWLVILILPFALFSFRKGVLYLLPLLLIIPPYSEAQNELQAEANSTSNPQQEQTLIGSVWQNLWSTPDQRAAKLIEKQDLAQAAQTFRRDDWAGVASFRSGDYAAAEQRFAATADVVNTYNRANALAFKGELEAAVEAYDQVLQKQADHTDASHNKEVVQQLLKQQQQQQNQDSEKQDADNQEQQQSPQSDAGEQSQSGEQSEQSQADQQGAESKTEKSEQQADQQNEQQTEPQTQGEGSENPDNSDQQQRIEQTSGEKEEPDKGEEQPQESLNFETTDEPLKDSSEQWLRGIKDDPGGLLRRKFEYQAWLRARDQQGATNAKPTKNPRY